MIRSILLSAVMMFAVSSWADILTLSPGTVVKEGVTISTTATLAAEGMNAELTNVGFGLRQKKVIFWVDVYVGQLFVANPGQYVKTADGALASLNGQPAVAMHFTFKRNVDADKIAEGFRDALTVNGVDLNTDTEMSTLMNAVAGMGEVRSGQTLTFAVAKNADGTETVVFENTSSTTRTHVAKGLAAGSMQKLLSMWLGQPSDDGVGRLKEELLN